MGRREGSVTILEISDTGPGVPAKARAHLFEAFQGSARAGGTGLGLAIAAELVRAHGGELMLVEGTIGATFRIAVPDRPVELAAARNRAHPGVTRLSPLVPADATPMRGVSFFVMAGYVPANPRLPCRSVVKTWMPGTFAGMTRLGSVLSAAAKPPCQSALQPLAMAGFDDTVANGFATASALISLRDIAFRLSLCSRTTRP